MPSLRSRLWRLPVKYTVRPVFNPRWSVATQRRLLRLATLPMRPPRGTHVETLAAPGPSGEWVWHDAAEPRHALLYLHGGAYITGSPATHRALAARLSRQANARVLLLDYRLAPEHPFPAALDDAVAAWRWLVSRGYEPGETLIAGDSAGGGLAVATLLALREAGRALPRRGYCLSPWVDLLLRGESMYTRAAADPMVTSAWLRASADLYAGGEDPGNPLLSPINADLAGLPPLLIQAGSDEVLLSDAQQLAEKARAAGVAISLDVHEGMWHVWQTFAGFVPEADRALARAGCFLQG